jgi:hypothetical protein
MQLAVSWPTRANSQRPDDVMNRPPYTKLFVLSACLAVAGCYKEYSEDFAEEETIVRNAAIGQQLADDALDIVYQAEYLLKKLPGGTTNFRIGTDTCGTIFDDAINKILTINYDTGCVAAYGGTHSGKIIVAYNSTLGDTLADRLVTFDHYVVNLKKVEGTVSLHDFAILPNGAFVAVRTLTDFKVTFPNGTGVTFNGSHDRVWTSGRGDNLATNNRYTFRGSMQGVSSTGRSFTQDITKPFIADFYGASQGYFARTYGIVELSALGGYPDRKRTVDYGSDSTKYDNTVTISTFRRTYGVTAD